MKKIILTFVGCIALICLHAQSSVSDVELISNPGSNASITNPMDSSFNVTCQVTLSDSINISKIHFIKASDHNGDNVIKSDTMDFYNNTNPEIQRSGLSITWEAGQKTIAERPYYIIRLEDFQGNLSQPYIKQ